MSSLDHIVLFVLLFILFFMTTRWKQDKLNVQYWQMLLPLSITYIFVLGFRYGWGNDWWGYRGLYEMNASEVYGGDERGFSILNGTLKSLGANYLVATIIYTVIFLYCSLFFIRGYENNKYMIALFLPATLLFNTAMIRQAIAFAFMFVSLRFLLDRKYLLSAVSAFVMVSIHGSTLFFAGLVFAFYLLQIVYKRPLPAFVTIPLYLFCVFFSGYVESWLSNQLGSFMATLDVADNFKGYVENSDSWFGADALQDIYEQSFFALTMNTLADVAFFYVGYIVLSKYGNEKVTFLYNVSVVGSLVLRVGLKMELVHRMGQSLQLFYFVPLGYVLYLIYTQHVNLGKVKRRRCNMCIFIFMTFQFLYYARFVFLNPRGSFIWNN